jgi:hypothetical protein
MSRKKVSALTIQMMEAYKPPTQSHVIGEHAEVLNQFTRSGEDGLMATGEVHAMGPEIVTYGYRARGNSWNGEPETRNLW